MLSSYLGWTLEGVIGNSKGSNTRIVLAVPGDAKWGSENAVQMESRNQRQRTELRRLQAQEPEASELRGPFTPGPPVHHPLVILQPVPQLLLLALATQWVPWTQQWNSGICRTRNIGFSDWKWGEDFILRLIFYHPLVILLPVPHLLLLAVGYLNTVDKLWRVQVQKPEIVYLGRGRALYQSP